jgi:hypothetical protein
MVLMPPKRELPAKKKKRFQICHKMGGQRSLAIFDFGVQTVSYLSACAFDMHCA